MFVVVAKFGQVPARTFFDMSIQLCNMTTSEVCVL